jgi:hypothetical protein
MAKGNWQLWIPFWNIFYMIREHKREKKEEKERARKHAALMAETDAVGARIEELKFERAHALVMGNKERAREITREIDEITAKQINKLLGK